MHLFISAVLLVLCSPFIWTEVVESFSQCSVFFKEPHVINNILEHSIFQDNNRYKRICQKYEDKYRFATLYDIRERIPIFSAYKFIAVNENPPHIPWMIEPQLYPLDGRMAEPGVNQALSWDYTLKCGELFPDTNHNTHWEPGQLFPYGHTPDDITAESTCTLTNTVPLNINFHRGSWRIMEENVTNFMQFNCRDENNSDNILAYVMTGAVPGNTRLNERVNIPSYMWTVFFCYNPNTNDWVSQAHWAENKDERNPHPIPEKTMEELEEFLRGKFQRFSHFSENY